MIDLIEPDWSVPANVRAVSGTRTGGSSEVPWDSLNLGLHVGDDPQCVAANRRAFAAAADLPAEPVWLEQVHGTDVLLLDQNSVRAGTPPVADAAWTREPGVVCCVMTADCLPVLLCNADGSAVAVAHAGWRGLAGGVIEATVAAMGGARVAWLGPAISAAAFEVGDEVREAFLANDRGAATAFVANEAGRWQADLYRLAERALGRAGVKYVSGGEFCTHGEPERFFSHRRVAPCGRMATLIWLAADS